MNLTSRQQKHPPVDHKVLKVGFWTSSDQPDLPMPVARPDPMLGQEDFLRRLKYIENYVTTRRDAYRGFSLCRICGQVNGIEEFMHTRGKFTFIWPSGYRHYVEDHNVMPDVVFLHFIEAAAKSYSMTIPGGSHV